VVAIEEPQQRKNWPGVTISRSRPNAICRWEGWKDPGTNEWLRTCTIITSEPNELVAGIHTRMPVILPEEDHAKWLGEAEDADLKALLKPFHQTRYGSGRSVRESIHRRITPLESSIRYRAI
jgi:putative SOS response-associated peptidase YedK